MAAGAQNPSEIVVLFDFTKGSALVAAAASLINCRKNQRNAQVLDFASDFWVSVGALSSIAPRAIPLLLCILVSALICVDRM